MGIACMKHDLVDYVVCGCCHDEKLDKLQEELIEEQELTHKYMRLYATLEKGHEVLNQALFDSQEREISLRERLETQGKNLHHYTTLQLGVEAKADAYEKAANEWMQKYDELKAKYEPDVLTTAR